MTDAVKKIKLEPYTTKHVVGLEVDRELDKLIYVHFADVDDYTAFFPRRIYAIDEDDNFEILLNEDLVIEDAYSVGNHVRPVRIISHDGNYYFHNNGFSKDKGKTFTNFSEVSSRSLAGYNLNGNVWYSTNNTVPYRFYVSFDEGSTWHKRYEEYDGRSFSVFGSKGNEAGNIIYAFLLYQWWPALYDIQFGCSLDYGLTWTNWSTGYGTGGWSHGYEIATNPDGSTGLLNYQNVGEIYRTTSYGANWSKVLTAGSVGGSGSYFRNMRYYYEDMIVLVTLTTEVRRLFYSEDGGHSWKEMPVPDLQQNSWIEDWYSDTEYQYAYYKGAVYLTWYMGPLFKTTDWGENWEPIWQQVDVNDVDFTASINYSSVYSSVNTIILGGHGYHPIRGTYADGMDYGDKAYTILSKDFGNTWRFVSELTSIEALLIDKISGNKIIGWTSLTTNYVKPEEQGRKIRISEDFGDTWETIDSVRLGCHPVGDYALANILVQYYDDLCLYLSPNGGRGWFKMNTPVTVGQYGISGDGNTIYIIENGAGWMSLYKTLNYGATWEDLGTIYTATDENLLVSYDGSKFVGQRSTSSLNLYSEGYINVIYTGMNDIISISTDANCEKIFVASETEIAYSLNSGNSFTNIDYENNEARKTYNEDTYYELSDMDVNWNLEIFTLISSWGLYIYQGYGKVGGLIKSISSASYRNPRDIGKVSQTNTFENLKKISSQPDDPQYLP